MSSHLGRNPFNKKSLKFQMPVDKLEMSSPAEWVLVKLPADSYIFALKTVLMIKDTWEKIKFRL